MKRAGEGPRDLETCPRRRVLSAVLVLSTVLLSRECFFIPLEISDAEREE